MVNITIAALRGGLTCCVFSLLIAGCGGGGGSGDSEIGGSDTIGQPNSPDKESKLVVEIDFPLPWSSPRGAAEIAVSGSLVDELDGTLDPGDVAQFVVNGVSPSVNLATGRWSGLVPLGTKAGQVLGAEVTDRNGIKSISFVNVDNQPEIPDYTFLSVLPGGDSAIVWGSGVLRRLDLVTGEEQQISDDPDAEKTVLSPTRKAFQVDEHGEQVYALYDCYLRDCGQSFPSVVSVHLDDASVRELSPIPWEGNYLPWEGLYLDVRDGQLAYSGKTRYAPARTPRCGLNLLDMETGTLSNLLDTYYSTVDFCPGALTLDTRRNRVIAVHDEGFGLDASLFAGLNAIDMSSGEISVVSGADIGSGPDLQFPRYLFATSSGESVLTLGFDGIYTVDLESGDRTLLFADPDLPVDLTDAGFDETHNRLLLAHDGRNISSLDLATGDVETLLSFSNGVGTGPDISINSPTVLDKPNDRLLVIDPFAGTLVEINLASLQRRVLVENLKFLSSTAPVLNEEGTVLYYQDDYSNLYKVDLLTGEPSLLSGGTSDAVAGSGPNLDDVNGMCLDSAKGVLYVIGKYALYDTPDEQGTWSVGVLSVDTVTGDRRIVSGEEMKLDLEDAVLDSILCDSLNERLLAASPQGEIIEINPASGQRKRLIEQSDVGTYVRVFAWDTQKGRVLLHVNNPSSGNEIRSINLATGEFDTVARIPNRWVYDRTAEVFYASRPVDNHIDEYYAVDRKSGSKVVIAHPE